jgi:subtilisin family serine protease
MGGPLRRVWLAVGLVGVLLVVASPMGSWAASGADPLRARQWHLDEVSAPRAWQAGRGEDVTVAVIDTGVAADHPDLAGQVATGYDATDPGSPPDDDNGHGTLIAGVIAALAGNGEGGVGVAPRASILPVRVLDEDGRGRPSEIAEGIRWATEHGADVMNLSFVEVPDDRGGLLDGLIDERVQQAIREARQAGVVVVAAAGNGGDDEVPYAADVPVVVGAATRDGTRWQRSNADDETLYAPGVDVVSTWTRDRYAQASGTSFAAPIVAGGAAILLQAGLEPDGVTRVLRQQANRVAPGAQNVAVVDLAAAVAAARGPLPAGDGGDAGDSQEPRTSQAASGATPQPAGSGDDGGSPDAGAAATPPAGSGSPDDADPGANEPADGGEGGEPGADDGRGEAGDGQARAPLEANVPEVIDARPAQQHASKDEPASQEAPEGRETASRDRLSDGDGGQAPGGAPVVVAWMLLGGAVAGHAGWWSWRWWSG